MGKISAARNLIFWRVLCCFVLSCLGPRYYRLHASHSSIGRRFSSGEQAVCIDPGYQAVCIDPGYRLKSLQPVELSLTIRDTRSLGVSPQELDSFTATVSDGESRCPQRRSDSPWASCMDRSFYGQTGEWHENRQKP